MRNNKMRKSGAQTFLLLLTQHDRRMTRVKMT